MKRKGNGRARVMRGQTHRQQWAIVYEDGARKRWRERACGNAMDMIIGFIEFVGSNKGKEWNTPSGVLPVRLLAPGGIIAAEHSVKPRRDKPANPPVKFPPKTICVDFCRVVAREQVEPTKTTKAKPGQFKPIARTGQLRGSGLGCLPGYPFLTLRDPHARKHVGK